VKGVALAKDREAIRDIIAAVPGGETYEAARRKVIAVLKANDFNDKASVRRAELLLQHWTGVAYSTVRYRVAMQDPEAFPWWQYLTMGDKRVRAAHSALDGKIFRYDSPVWQKILPPWEPGCRCSWRELNDFQVEDIRKADEKLEPAQRRFMEGAMLERAEKGELITATKLVELKNGVPVKTSWAPVQPYSLEPREGWIGWNPENMVPSPEFLQKALKPESYAELMKWAATRKVDGGATVKEWIDGLPQAKRSAAKAAKKVKPAAPRPSDRISLPAAMQRTGFKPEDRRTWDKAEEFLDLLKEGNPLPSSAVVESIRGDGGAVSNAVIAGWVQSFLDYMPPAVAATLPKLAIVRAKTGDTPEHQGRYDAARKELTLFFNGRGMDDPDTARRVTFHEMAHWLETATGLKADRWRAALDADFKERTRAERAAGKARNAGAYHYYEDELYEPYAGKVDGSEFATMHLELLSSARALIDALIMRPEFAARTLAALKLATSILL